MVASTVLVFAAQLRLFSNTAVKTVCVQSCYLIKRGIIAYYFFFDKCFTNFFRTKPFLTLKANRQARCVQIRVIRLCFSQRIV
jgi:hypothetical protein